MKRMKGFTLVEILLALAIVGVGLVGILSIFVVGANTVRNAVERTEASFIAQIVFEEFKRQGHTSVTIFTVPTLPAHYTNNPDTNLNYSVPEPTPADVDSTNAPNLKRVDITVNKGNRAIAQFTTFIAQL